MRGNFTESGGVPVVISCQNIVVVFRNNIKRKRHSVCEKVCQKSYKSEAADYNDKENPENFRCCSDCLFLNLCYCLQYTDNAGEVKMLARGEIGVQVEGGELLALGSACPYNERGYLTDKTDTYFGEALAIVRPAADATEVIVRASSPYGNAEARVRCK